MVGQEVLIHVLGVWNGFGKKYVKFDSASHVHGRGAVTDEIPIGRSPNFHYHSIVTGDGEFDIILTNDITYS